MCWKFCHAQHFCVTQTCDHDILMLFAKGQYIGEQNVHMFADEILMCIFLAINICV